MKNAQEIVVNITNGIRKIEDLLDVQCKTQRVINHEVKCLHKCLEKAMKEAGLSIDADGAVIYGGGTPKNDSAKED